MMDAACTRARAAGQLLAVFHQATQLAPQAALILRLGGLGFTCEAHAHGAASAHQTLEATRVLERAAQLARTAFGQAESPRPHAVELHTTPLGVMVTSQWSGPGYRSFSPMSSSDPLWSVHSVGMIGLFAGFMGAPGWAECVQGEDTLTCPSPEAAVLLGALRGANRTPIEVITAMRLQPYAHFDGVRIAVDNAHNMASAYAEHALEAAQEAVVHA